MRLRMLIGLLGCVGLVGGLATLETGTAYASGTTATFTSALVGTQGQTASFGEGGPWQMKWSYNCSNYGYPGNFIVNINGGSGLDIGSNELGMSGSGTDHYTDTGTFSLSVNSECAWSITVSPDSTGVAPGSATFTSSQVGTAGQTARFQEAGPWQMAWHYDCSNFGYDGNFQVYINGGSNFDIGPNELGMSGSGTDHYTDTGTFSLSVNSECAWSITVSGPPVGSPPPAFTPRPGYAQDIAAGANGSIWIVGTSPAPGGYGIYRWAGSSWAPISGAAVRLAVDSAGNPWVVNSSHQIWHWNGRAFGQYPGAATDIGVGANGSVWIVGTNAVPGGSGVWHWSGTGWVPVPGAAVRLAVDPAGNPWLVNSSHQIWHWNGRAFGQYPGAATDIGVGANGSVWSVGINPVPGGDGIWHWNGGGWTPTAGGGVAIAVASNGHPWVINSAHQIFAS